MSALWPERGVKFSPARIKRFESELERVARFAGLTRVEFAAGWLREAL